MIDLCKVHYISEVMTSWLGRRVFISSLVIVAVISKPLCDSRCHDVMRNSSVFIYFLWWWRGECGCGMSVVCQFNSNPFVLHNHATLQPIAWLDCNFCYYRMTLCDTRCRIPPLVSWLKSFQQKFHQIPDNGTYEVAVLPGSQDGQGKVCVSVTSILFLIVLVAVRNLIKQHSLLNLW